MTKPTAALARLPSGAKAAILFVVAIAALGVALAVPPFAQDPAYHGFADRRAWLGIANFANVASNLGYLAAGLLGLAFLAGPAGRACFAPRWQAAPWFAFFGGVMLVGLGSSWYHLAPGNATLLWDRLPMSIAFLALFSGFVTDRVNAHIGVFVVLPVMLALGAASVVYWSLTETAGHGDLRFYFLLNPVLPALILTLLCLMFPGRVTDGRALAHLLFWYGGAIVCEQFDHEIFALTGGAVGGHTIKHLLSAAAVVAVAAMLRRTARQPVASPPASA